MVASNGLPTFGASEGDKITGFAGMGLFTYVATVNHGIWISDDNGETWTAANNHLHDTNVVTLAISGGNLIAGTYTGGFLSTDEGQSWIVSGLPIEKQYVFATVGADLFAAGIYNSMLYLSPDNGLTLSDSIMLPSSVGYLTSFTAVGGDLLLGADNVWISHDRGQTWNTAFPASSGGWVVGGSDHAVFAFANSDIYLSIDGGLNWKLMDDGLPASKHIYGMVAGSAGIFAAVFGGGVYQLDSLHSTWSAMNDGFPDTAHQVIHLGLIQNALFASTDPIAIGNQSVPVWRRSFGASSSVSSSHSENDLTSLYPNPSQNLLTVNNASHVTL